MPTSRATGVRHSSENRKESGAVCTAACRVGRPVSVPRFQHAALGFNATSTGVDRCKIGTGRYSTDIGRVSQNGKWIDLFKFGADCVGSAPFDDLFASVA